MYSIKQLSIILLAFASVTLSAQQGIIEETIEKEVTVNIEDDIKTITIVKKIGDNKEEVIEWKGGIDEELPESLSKEMQDVEVIVEEDSDTKQEKQSMKVIVMEMDSSDSVRKWEGEIGDQLPEDIQQILTEHDIDLETLTEDGEGSQRMRIKIMDEDGTHKVMKWDGKGEMPEGVNPKKEMRVMKFIDEDGNEQILEWDGNGPMPKAMKDKHVKHMREHKHKPHREMGSRGEKHNGRGYGHKYGKKAKLGIEIEETAAGIVVNDVIEGTGAALAGLQQGDIIKAVDDTTIDHIDRLYAELATHNPGDSVKVKVLRNGSSKKFNVTLK